MTKEDKDQNRLDRELPDTAAAIQTDASNSRVGRVLHLDELEHHVQFNTVPFGGPTSLLPSTWLGVGRFWAFLPNLFRYLPFTME